MCDIPFEIKVLYNALLAQKVIPERFHNIIEKCCPLGVSSKIFIPAIP